MVFESGASVLLASLNTALGLTGSNPSNPANPYDYSSLGTFENNIDKNEQRVYLQSGRIRNVKPRSMEILTQQPDCTIVVKKKQFSSLVDNYRPELMSQDEKFYLKVARRLFYNKCRAIAAYERLSKIETVLERNPTFNSFILTQVLSATDTLNTLSPGLIGGKTLATLNTLKQMQTLSQINTVTTWVQTQEFPYISDLGDGTGVIELTLATSVNITNSLQFGGGSASIEMQDPLRLTIIRDEDIDQALSDCLGFTNNPFFSITEGQLGDTIKLLQEEFNRIRRSRGAPLINILITDNTIVFKRVRAVVDEVGQEIIFTFNGGLFQEGTDSVAIDESSLGGTGLVGEEVSFFQQLITNYYTLLGSQDTRKNQIKSFNKENQVLRRKLSSDFAGKCIVQPMDEVRIFMGSRSLLDSKISRGLAPNFSDNPVNQIDKALGNLDAAVGDIAGAYFGAHTFIEAERDAMAGPDFPLWLWYMLRNNFTREAAGTHVFAGVVYNPVRQSYSNGAHTVSFTVSDNTKYLEMSQVNYIPGLDTVDSSLYDPLTPFKTDFDTSSGFLKGGIPQLLEENVSILNSGLLRFNAGRNRGKIVDGNNFTNHDYEILTPENLTASKFRQTLFDPAGLIYRFKTGIGSLALSGSPHSFGTGSLQSEATPVVSTDPFSGQDVMNVLSIFVTGQPYNYNNFIKASVGSGLIDRADLFNSTWSDSYFKGLITSVNKNNATWGNFIPFKKMTLNNAAYNFMKSGEFDVTQSNAKINDLLKQRAEAFDNLTTIFPQLAATPQFYTATGEGSLILNTDNGSGIDTNTLSRLTTSILDLDLQIEQESKALQASLANGNLSGSAGSIKIVGDDISYDPTYGFSAGDSEEDQLRAQEEFRRKLLRLTRRPYWKTKANQDVNYFIVDDSYDKNYDIQAFEDSLVNGFNTFNSTYVSIGDKATMVAKMLGLEFFADTQGHINARPPAYNRLPSSVFFKMLKDSEVKGFKLFPDYLESLFFNQMKSLTDKLETLEDQIRLRAAAIDYRTDAEVTQLLGGTQFSSSGSDAFFSFVTGEDGTIGGNFKTLIMQSAPDFLEDTNRAALTELSTTLRYSTTFKYNFDSVKKASASLQSYKISAGGEEAINSRIATITARLQAKGVQVPSKMELTPNVLSTPNSLYGSRTQTEVLGVLSQISQLLAERQSVVKVLSNSLKNLEEGAELNADPQLGSQALFTTLTKTNRNFPEILLHMIEDEEEDDLGIGSGKRYVIRESDIISYSIEETAPPFTLVEVNGSIDNGLVQGADGISVGDSGNLMNTAFSVDYDSWHQYGFRGKNVIPISYFSDPETQCAPFGTFLLNQAKKNIFTCQLEIRGNEFIQPGEVYYLEDLDLVGYAESVSHSFTYGTNFTTSIKLTYLRKPGEFIPTMLDIIGKGLYTNKNYAATVRNVRNVSSLDEIPLGVIVKTAGSVEDDSLATEDLQTLLGNAFGKQNQQTLNSLLLAGAGLVAPTRYGDSVSIQVRLFYNSNEGPISSDLENLGNAIQTWVQNPSIYDIQSGKTPQAIATKDDKAPTIDPKLINIVKIDLGDLSEPRAPSSAAWAATRMLQSNDTPDQSFGTVDGTNFGNVSALDQKILYNNVIDLVAVIGDPATETLDSHNTDDTTLDPDLLERRLKYQKNINLALGVKEIGSEDLVATDTSAVA